MYAVAFDLTIEVLKVEYPNDSYPNAYREIEKVLVKYGFTRQQGSVFFGNESVTPVTTVLAVQELATTYDWFSKAVRDIRMLRIEENNDLMPAIYAAVGVGKQTSLDLQGFSEV
jgi:virulence-associated protein VapD